MVDLTGSPEGNSDIVDLTGSPDTHSSQFLGKRRAAKPPLEPVNRPSSERHTEERPGKRWRHLPEAAGGILSDVSGLTGSPQQVSSVGVAKPWERAVIFGPEKLSKKPSSEMPSSTSVPAECGNTEPLALQHYLLENILRRASPAPNGPSWRENALVDRLTEFGIEPYGFEVPLGNGVCDCVGVDAQASLCV